MKLLRTFSLSIALCGAVLAAHADEFSFTFSGPGVTGSGTVDATPDASDPGAYYVTDGTATINGTVWAITGGNATPGSYLNTADNSYGYVMSYDNVLFVPPPSVDSYGLLFTDGSDDSNLYYESGTYYFTPSLASDQDTDNIPVTMTVAPAPEPASVVYSGTGLVAMAGLMAFEVRRRRIAGDAI
jgi:hypothetical protein